MRRSKFVSGLAGFGILLMLSVSVLTMSLCLSIKRNVKAAMLGAYGTEDKSVFAENVDMSVYSAILAEDKIYIYDRFGAVYKAAEYDEAALSEEKKRLLSDGITIYGERELEAFMDEIE